MGKTKLVTLSECAVAGYLEMVRSVTDDEGWGPGTAYQWVGDTTWEVWEGEVYAAKEVWDDVVRDEIEYQPTERTLTLPLREWARVFSQCVQEVREGAGTEYLLREVFNPYTHTLGDEPTVYSLPGV